MSCCFLIVFSFLFGCKNSESVIERDYYVQCFENGEPVFSGVCHSHSVFCDEDSCNFWCYNRFGKENIQRESLSCASRPEFGGI